MNPLAGAVAPQPTDLAAHLVTAEREVAGRRGRDMAARWVAAARVADVVALLALLLPWIADAQTAVSGVELSLFLTAAAVLGIALRQVVLGAVAAQPDSRSQSAVLLINVLSVGGVIVALVSHAELMTLLADYHDGWAGPLLFAVAFLAGSVLAIQAGGRIRTAVAGVDLLAGFERMSPETMRERLHDADADALRRPRRSGPPSFDRAGGRGAAVRLSAMALAPAAIGLPALFLAWSGAHRQGGPGAALDPAQARWPALVLGLLAALTLLALHILLRRGARLRWATLLAVGSAALSSGAALACLGGIADAVRARLLVGPAGWLGLGAFACSAALGFLVLGCLYEAWRDARRGPDDLDAAQARVDAALRVAAPPW